MDYNYYCNSDSVSGDGPIVNNLFDVCQGDIPFKLPGPAASIPYEEVGRLNLNVVGGFGIEKAVKGEIFDVAFLLSICGARKSLVRPRDGSSVGLETLRGKYLILCSLILPLEEASDVEIEHCEEMIKAYPKLVKNGFEMIFVTNTRDKSAFDTFFSGFPGVTISFNNVYARNTVCSYLHNKPGVLTQSGLMVGVMVDPSQKVLREEHGGHYFSQFGAAFFPFTDERVSALVEKYSSLNWRLNHCTFSKHEGALLVSLADLLFCNPHEKLKRLGGGSDEISVDELNKNNCVGVYLCVDGSFLMELASMYRECKAKKLEFEIIIVCLWFDDTPSTEEIQEIKDYCSKTESTSSSWWLFPCSFESKCLLNSLSTDEMEENLFIVRPDDKPWCSFGKYYLLSDGINSYPFTTEGIFERMSSLKLDSLTKPPYQYYSGSHSESDSDSNDFLERLRNKNVLVYFDNPKKLEKDWVKLLNEVYSGSTPLDAELVFVPVHCHDEEETGFPADVVIPDCTWLTGLQALNAAEQVFTKSEMKNKRKTMVAFGKDGSIRSFCVQAYLKEPHKLAALFDVETPRKEFTDSLRGRVGDHESDVADSYREPDNW